MEEIRRSYRIAILAHGLRGGGGISVGRNIIAALGRVAPQNEYFCTVPAGLGYEELCADVPNCEAFVYNHRGGPLGRWWDERHLFPKLVRRFKPDVVWSLSQRGLHKSPCPQAVLVQTAYVCYPTRYWGLHGGGLRLRNRYNRWQFRRQLANVQLVFCQTPVMKERLIDAYGYGGPVELCPNAVSQFTLAGAEGGDLPEPLRPHADKMRLLCLTQYYTHKNLESIAAMFERYSQQLRDIVVVTTVDPNSKGDPARFMARIAREPVCRHIVNVGPLPQGSLGRYFGNCHGFLLPTLLESFSGTYLEAMHFGTPILTSDLDFAGYACGDAALYFNPWDPAAMRDAICRLRDEPALGEELARRGARRLKTLFRGWDDIVADALVHLRGIIGDV